MNTMPTAIPTPSVVPPGGRSISPLEFAQALSPEDKHEVFVALLQELLAGSDGSGLIPFEGPDGQFLGYYVPPKAAAARAAAVVPALSPEREGELGRRRNEPGRMISEDELRTWIKQATPAENP
jgi:hypothetical protein